MRARFIWDPRKAATNRLKHGITFEEAVTCFTDPLGLLLEDKAYEDRLVLIASSARARLVLTVYAEIADDLVRIISARRATRPERRGVMKKARIEKGPTRASLRAMPEIDFSRYRVRRNRFAKRIASDGMEIVHHGPSAASLREMPEPDLRNARVRRNPWAEKIRAGGIALQVGRGRPRRDDEVGPTVTRSVRLPPATWAQLEKRARAEGVAVHALLRRAIAALVGRVA